MNPEEPVQRQLDAYNAHDLERFVAEYAEDTQVFVPPATEPSLKGKRDVADHDRRNRFALPDLHADVLQRIVSGNTVVDLQRVTGLQADVVEAVAVYRITEGLITAVWFH